MQIHSCLFESSWKKSDIKRALRYLWTTRQQPKQTVTTAYEVDMENLLANSCLFTHPADKEHH